MTDYKPAGCGDRGGGNFLLVGFLCGDGRGGGILHCVPFLFFSF